MSRHPLFSIFIVRCIINVTCAVVFVGVLSFTALFVSLAEVPFLMGVLWTGAVFVSSSHLSLQCIFIMLPEQRGLLFGLGFFYFRFFFMS